MRLEECRGGREGRTVVFLGNGTTLNEFDVGKIPFDVDMAACNYYLPFGPARWGRWPDLYFCHDPSVLFVPWEAHRRLKRLPAPADYDLAVASQSPAACLDKAWEARVVLPTDLSWWGGFGVKAVLGETSRAECDGWLRERRDRFVGYAPVVPMGQPWRAWFRRRVLYRGRHKDRAWDPRTYRPPGRLARWLIAPQAWLMEEMAHSRVPLWALNSFCAVMLPVLFFLGYARIVLLGVDFDKRGYFFCPYDTPSGQRAFYREEFDDLAWLFALAARLPHRPVIQAVRASRNLVQPPGGLVEFEALCSA